MKKAFTLAEVLITLTIIGVIAALTIPNLMSKWEDQHTVSAVKEAYSILNNAIKMAVAENGPVEDWTWPDTTTDSLTEQNANYIIDVLKPYLKFSQICYSANGCMGADYKNFYGDSGWGYWADLWVYGKAILKNGMAMSINRTGYGSAMTKTYWQILVDINGKKGPNRYGYDVFLFLYTSNKLIGHNWGSDYCKFGKQRNFAGATCSYWILKHGNMDYKYRDVSAEW